VSITERIYHLAKYYPPIPGGIETHVQTLARAQAALGMEVHVICINGSTASRTSFHKTATVEEFDQEVQVTRISRHLMLARLDLSLELLPRLNQLPWQPGTIFHLHTPNPTMLIALLGRVGHTQPLVVTHHSDIIRQQILKYVLRPFEHLVYRKASRILTTSAEYIPGSRFLQLYKENIDFLPLGLDCAAYRYPSSGAKEFAQSLQQYGSPLWLVVGRLVYYKALHVAIAALKQVPGKLLIIGHGPLEEQLRDQAREMGVSDRILWHGHASPDELVGAYRAATALWFPSNARSEGFGLVQVEAMASGCPVINAAIPCSGVPWVSRHEQEGLTVPLDHPTALAEAAKRLLYEPGLRERLSASSQRRAKEFDHLTMAKRSLEIYEQVQRKFPHAARSGKPTPIY
jgi:glycosyltransferase involved in cell wall biosynthesis